MATAILVWSVSDRLNALECDLALPPVIESLRQTIRRTLESTSITAEIQPLTIRDQPAEQKQPGKAMQAALVFSMLGGKGPFSPKPEWRGQDEGKPLRPKFQGQKWGIPITANYLCQKRVPVSGYILINLSASACRASASVTWKNAVCLGSPVTTQLFRQRVPR
jgi:hypothetical protein